MTAGSGGAKCSCARAEVRPMRSGSLLRLRFRHDRTPAPLPLRWQSAVAERVGKGELGCTSGGGGGGSGAQVVSWQSGLLVGSTVTRHQLVGQVRELLLDSSASLRTLRPFPLTGRFSQSQG